MANLQLHQNNKTAYVYEIIVADVVRYIGKGTGNRVADHAKMADRINRNLTVGKKTKRSYFYKRLAEALRLGNGLEHRIIEFGLSNEEAYDLERRLIASFPEYQLWNVAPGGNGHTSEFLKKIWSDPGRLKNHSEMALKAWAEHPEWRSARFSDPGAKSRQSEMVRAKWRDPEYREMQKLARANGKKPKRVKFSEKASNAAKARWADPKFRERAISAMKVSCGTPENRRYISERMKKIWADPAFKQKWRMRRSGKVCL